MGVDTIYSGCNNNVRAQKMIPTTEESIVVGKCVEAISRLTDAIRYPKVAVQDIRRAQELLAAAMEAARVMEPEE